MSDVGQIDQRGALYRGARRLGNVRLRGTIDASGRVTGTIRADDPSISPGAPLPIAWLPAEAGTAADLRLELSDGRVITLMLKSTSGELVKVVSRWGDDHGHPRWQEHRPKRHRHDQRASGQKGGVKNAVGRRTQAISVQRPRDVW